jgi:hypothetical protein
MEQYATISPEDLDLFCVTDDIDEAVRHLRRRVDESLPELRHPGPAEEVHIPKERRISGEGTRFGKPATREA